MISPAKISPAKETDRLGGSHRGLPPHSWRRRLYVNARLRVLSIRGFQRRWFVPAQEPDDAPNHHQIEAVNTKLRAMRGAVEANVSRLGALMRRNSPSALETFKEVNHEVDRQFVAVQHIWDFFFDIFSQRRSVYAAFLRRCDSVVDECYALVFRELPIGKPWTETPPYCYLEKAFSPATIRRGVGLLPRGPFAAANPFPVIKIPYDRIGNPWALTTLHHEVSHNIHGDIPGLWQRTQIEIYRALRRAGMEKSVAKTWARWHKETLADTLGLVLGGPAVVHAMMDLFSRPRRIVMQFRPHDSHPTIYLRVFVSTHMLRRLGFSAEANDLERRWTKRYPLDQGHRIPKPMVETASRAIPVVVGTLMWKRYSELHGRRLVDLVRYTPRVHEAVLAGARMLGEGRPPSMLPRRHVISAGVYAFEQWPDKARVIRHAMFEALDRGRDGSSVTPMPTNAAPKKRDGPRGVGAMP